MNEEAEANSRPSDPRLRDPLSEVTRKERRVLLGVSAIGIVIVKSGLVPSKVSALGIDFTPANQQALILALGAVVGYFLVAFIIYAASDLTAWRIAFRRLVPDRTVAREEEMADWYRKIAEGKEGEEAEWFLKQAEFEKDAAVWRRKRSEQLDAQQARWLRFVVAPVSALRAVFEFAVPVIIGIYAMMLLLTASPPPQPPTSQP